MSAGQPASPFATPHAYMHVGTHNAQRVCPCAHAPRMPDLGRMADRIACVSECQCTSPHALECRQLTNPLYCHASPLPALPLLAPATAGRRSGRPTYGTVPSRARRRAPAAAPAANRSTSVRTGALCRPELGSEGLRHLNLSSAVGPPIWIGVVSGLRDRLQSWQPLLLRLAPSPEPRTRAPSAAAACTCLHRAAPSLPGPRPGVCTATNCAAPAV